MQDQTDDRTLITRIAGQDQAALRALLGRHQLRVYRFVLRIVRREAVAEEVTNEVFLEAWRNAKSYEARSSVGTWLLSIAHNRAVSAMRRRREEAIDEETAGAIADDSDDPEVVAQKLDKAAQMRRCISALSAEHRTIIDLVYYHEKSINEVSEILGIPLNTVKTRMFYARKKLSELLAAAGIDRGWP
jgi:RNA polymerase sigma-70 factor (ECF subfamily)